MRGFELFAPCFVLFLFYYQVKEQIENIDRII